MITPRFRRDIIFVLLWLGVIFFLSTDNGSAEHTNSFLDHYFRLWMGAVVSHWSAAQFDLVHYCVRKAAHVTIYLILAILTMRAIISAPQFTLRRWAALLSWAFATFYAMTDEFHQRFVSSRTPKVTDVMIDSVGAFLGVLLFLAVGKILSIRQQRIAGVSVRRGATEAA